MKLDRAVSDVQIVERATPRLTRRGAVDHAKTNRLLPRRRSPESLAAVDRERGPSAANGQPPSTICVCIFGRAGSVLMRRVCDVADVLHWRLCFREAGHDNVQNVMLHES